MDKKTAEKVDYNVGKWENITDAMKKIFSIGGNIIGTVFLGKELFGGDSPGNKSGVMATARKYEGLVKPFLGLAGLTSENERRFGRKFDELDSVTQSQVAAYLLDEFIYPVKQGIVTKTISGMRYDAFMLRVVNRDTPRESKGSIKTSTVTKEKVSPYKPEEETSPPENDESTETVTTTEREETSYTDGGDEGTLFLQNLGSIYEQGGKRAADEYMQLNRMPMLSSETLKKVDDAINGTISTLFSSSKDSSGQADSLREAIHRGSENYLERKASLRKWKRWLES